MEVVLVIVAFWVVLIGLYAVWPLLRLNALTSLWRKPQANLIADLDLTRHYNDQVAAAAESLIRPPLRPTLITQEPRPLVQGLSTEVDRLRAEVEHLRSELAAATVQPPPQPVPVVVSMEPPAREPRQPQPYERPRPRHYRTGAYTYLPRPLRRLVSEVRSTRRFSHA